MGSGSKLLGVTPFRMQVLLHIGKHHDPKDHTSWVSAAFLSRVMEKPRGFIVKAAAELVEGGLARRSIDSFKLSVKGRAVYDVIREVFVREPTSGPTRPLSAILRGEE